ncbi:hypothetical protein OHQ88_33665 (plasmid) [Micromonospora zamorensis]|uniref:hypothetical protein n=1 Tax=Micromonospora zamorensis TaxID=709883 RepID=UPI002E1CC0BD
MSTEPQQRSPFIVVENPHGFPGEDASTPGLAPPYLIYATPDVATAGQRFASAGLELIGTAPSLAAAYRDAGITLEAASPVFVPE